jgi:hypothetical protein
LAVLAITSASSGRAVASIAAEKLTDAGAEKEIESIGRTREYAKKKR